MKVKSSCYNYLGNFGKRVGWGRVLSQLHMYDLSKYNFLSHAEVTEVQWTVEPEFWVSPWYVYSDLNHWVSLLWIFQARLNIVRIGGNQIVLSIFKKTAIQSIILKWCSGTGEMDKHLRGLAPLSEDLSLVPSHPHWAIWNCSSRFGHPLLISGPLHLFMRTFILSRHIHNNSNN